MESVALQALREHVEARGGRLPEARSPSARGRGSVRVGAGRGSVRAGICLDIRQPVPAGLVGAGAPAADGPRRGRELPGAQRTAP